MPRNKIQMTEKHFVDVLDEVLIGNGYLTQRELGVGHGIADLVITKLDTSNIAVRETYKQHFPLFDRGYFEVLRNIPDYQTHNEPIDLNDLCKLTALSENKIKYSIIKSLKEHGYIKEVATKKFLKIDGWVPLAKEVIAFEAKLRDWKSGFYQANRYQSFADKVYLVIPTEYAHLPDIALFRKFGIGLMTFDIKTKVRKVLIRPKQSRFVDSDRKNLAIEYLFQKQIIYSR